MGILQKFVTTVPAVRCLWSANRWSNLQSKVLDEGFGFHKEETKGVPLSQRGGVSPSPVLWQGKHRIWDWMDTESTTQEVSSVEFHLQGLKER